MSSTSDKEAIPSTPPSDKENTNSKRRSPLRRLEDSGVKKIWRNTKGCKVAVVKPLIVNRPIDYYKIKPCSVHIRPINWDPIIILNRV